MTNKIIAAKIKPYTIKLDDGTKCEVKDEVWVGNFLLSFNEAEDDDDYFSGAVFSDGRCDGTLTVSKKDWLTSVDFWQEVF